MDVVTIQPSPNKDDDRFIESAVVVVDPAFELVAAVAVLAGFVVVDK